MKQKEISALSLEVVSQFFDGNPEPLMDHLSENVLWLGPRDGQFLHGKDLLCRIIREWHENITYSLGNISTQISPVGKKGMNVILFYDILAHLPEGTSVVNRQRTLLAWEEQKLQVGDEEDSAPRMTMIMVSNSFSSEGNRFPFDEIPARAKTGELPKRILVRGMKDESHYLDADGVIYIESTDSSHHSLIHTEDKIIPCLDKVTSLAERYGDCLLRCHASYLVNPFYVRSLKRFSLTLSDGTVLPVPEKKYTAFKRMLNTWAENHKKA